MDDNLRKYSILGKLNVSRGTCIDFEKFISLILEKNQEINIISKKTESIIRERHIIDSALDVNILYGSATPFVTRSSIITPI